MHAASSSHRDTKSLWRNRSLPAVSSIFRGIFPHGRGEFTPLLTPCALASGHKTTCHCIFKTRFPFDAFIGGYAVLIFSSKFALLIIILCIFFQHPRIWPRCVPPSPLFLLSMFLQTSHIAPNTHKIQFSSSAIPFSLNVIKQKANTLLSPSHQARHRHHRGGRGGP